MPGASATRGGGGDPLGGLNFGGAVAPVDHGGFLLQTQSPSLERLLVEACPLALPLELRVALPQMLRLLCAVDHLFRRHVLLFGARRPALHPRNGDLELAKGEESLGLATWA